MIRTNSVKLALATILCVAASAPVMAQTTSEGEITVTAPRTVERSPTGMAIETMMATRVVNYSDLNLRTGDGEIALQNRVKEAARKACEALDHAYPLTPPAGPACMNTAAKEAAPQIKAAVAAARAK
jgi:UrcA family protein